MNRWKVVGWTHANPTDHTVAPQATVVFVEAEDRPLAFDVGELALVKVLGTRSRGLLNWYVEKVPEAPCDHKFLNSRSCLKCGWLP